jgi:hypothetical protein
MRAMGDDNVANVRNQRLFQQLNELKKRITDSDAVSEHVKMDVAVDVETRKTQALSPGSSGRSESEYCLPSGPVR